MLYRTQGALHHSDADPAGFRWLIDGGETSIFAFCRSSAYGGAPLIAAINMTPTARTDVRLGAPLEGRWLQILNSDAGKYGGSDFATNAQAETGPLPWQGFDQSLVVSVPPLGALLYRYDGA
jgi:1,4-alpha-glucan branching enzyme